ncbi:LytTr DNA-binding domain protein [compost metagenome]
MNIKTIGQQLPANFYRIAKSFIVNANQITSLDNNFAYINEHEIPIGNSYRDAFFEEYFKGKVLLK